MTHEQALQLSGIIQISLLVATLLISRFWLKNRQTILTMCVAATIMVFVADILVDGQGACFKFIYAPIVYVLATALRKDL